MSSIGLSAFLKGGPEFPLEILWFPTWLSEIPLGLFPNGPLEFLVTLLEFP